MSGPSRILVVDDEPANVKLLEAHLSLQGYEIVAAADGTEALRILAERPIDLVLLDIMMPGLDGFEVTRRLRADPRTRLVPVVLVTALKETADRVRGIEAGCDDFISKPFDKHEVLARVKTLLTLSYYRSLLDEREKFASVVDRINEGILVLDPALRVAHANAPARTLLNLHQDPATDLVPHLMSTFTAHYAGDLGMALRSMPLTVDLERPETDAARPLILEVRSSVLRDPSGAISSIVLTVRDVTDERLDERMKQDFLSLLSHKLRTPIAVIAESASALLDGLVGPLTTEQTPLVRAIEGKIRALGHLIEQLLAFSAMEGERRTRSPEPILLRQELARVLETLVPRQGGKPVNLQISCDDGEAELVIDRKDLTLIVRHLVDNAIKFNDKARIELTVAITRAAQTVSLAVTDNGPGIPPEAQEKIFARFTQLEKEFTGNVEGAGLGLALVKRLVASYGGRVDVRSELGRGSTFTVTFPVRALGVP